MDLVGGFVVLCLEMGLLLVSLALIESESSEDTWVLV